MGVTQRVAQVTLQQMRLILTFHNLALQQAQLSLLNGVTQFCCVELSQH